MMHDDSILSLSCSNDGEMLASGSADGIVKVWRLRTGSCLRKFTAHLKGVTSVAFARDGSSVLTSSHDLTIKIHGLNSGRMLKEFRGHTSFVNHAEFSADGNRIISCSSDGSVRLWDYKTTDCIISFKISPERSILNVHNVEDRYYVTSKNNSILVLANLFYF